MILASHAEFLQQAYRNNQQRYARALQADGPDAARGWDLCVLTASDERQAGMYRRQIAWRLEAGLLPPRTRFHVIADPGGKRIGSGAATLRTLSWLEQQDEALADKRVLIIHSGGDSRRLPHCSAVGKLFARVPRVLPDGRASTLFDEFLISLSGLADEAPPGVLVAAGDVLLVFDHLQLSLQRDGVIGVSAAAPAEMGLRHGVYALGKTTHQVRAYLHKPSPAKLAQWEAVGRDGTVGIDTGLVWLDAVAVNEFLHLTEAPVIARLCRLDTSSEPAPSSQLNLYGDLLLPLAQSTSREDYLADTSDGPATPDVSAAREIIWRELRDLPFAVEQLQPAAFIHFGTTHEYWHTVASDPVLRQVCGWSARASDWLESEAMTVGNQLATISSAVEGAVRPGEHPALVMDSRLSGALSWQGLAVIANTCTALPLSLAQDIVIHQLPVGDGWVTRIYGARDDPKLPWASGTATFTNRPWPEWLAAAGLDAQTVWPSVSPDERSLWNAQLYPIAREREASLRQALALQSPESAPPGWKQAWLASRRMSLKDSFTQANSDRLLSDAAAVEDHIAGRRFYAAVIAEHPAQTARAELGPLPDGVARRAQLVGDWLSQADATLRLRGYQALNVATGLRRYEELAFATLAKMMQVSVNPPARLPEQPQPRLISYAPGSGTDRARVEAAARIDFGGGWTDTPPYSIERGGAVLNAAVKLRGAYPIVAEAAWLPEPRLVLDSDDIGATLAPRTVGEMLAYTDPADPFALHKAALVMRGVVSPDDDPARSIASAMQSFGRGVRLRTQTFIPRGSGLGTSSILAGAVLACLGRLTGLDLPQARLFDEVLNLEQMLTTGGGWQDQVGGLVGGIKLITTAPGLPQRIRVEPVQLSPAGQAGLEARLMVVYTGQQRLAKNLLHAMMARWMAREPNTVGILGDLAQLALAMREALEGGRLDEFGGLIDQHWALNKRLDAGCTNPFIDGLFEAARPYISGGKLAGAGGGGFAIMIARDAQAALRLTAILAQRYAGTGVGIWPCDLPSEGMRTIDPAAAAG